MAASGKPQVIAVASGKGGVGKTNLAGNLAVTFSQMKKNVLIFDADLGLANLDVLFGLAPRKNIRQVIEGRTPLRDIIIKGPNGISILPAASGVAELAEGQPAYLEGLANEIQALASEYDVLLIDAPPGIGTNVRKFSALADELLVVTTPEPTAVTDAYALVKVMRRENPNLPMRLIVNMATDLAEAERVASAFSEVTMRFLGMPMPSLGGLPWDDHLSDAVRRQMPVVTCHPNCRASRCLLGLGRTLLKTPAHQGEDTLPAFHNRILRWMKK